MSEREQIINFLLQQCDSKQSVINQLQAQVAELQKKAEEKASN